MHHRNTKNRRTKNRRRTNRKYLGAAGKGKYATNTPEDPPRETDIVCDSSHSYQNFVKCMDNAVKLGPIKELEYLLESYKDILESYNTDKAYDIINNDKASISIGASRFTDSLDKLKKKFAEYNTEFKSLTTSSFRKKLVAHTVNFLTTRSYKNTLTKFKTLLDKVTKTIDLNVIGQYVVTPNRESISDSLIKLNTRANNLIGQSSNLKKDPADIYIEFSDIFPDINKPDNKLNPGTNAYNLTTGSIPRNVSDLSNTHNTRKPTTTGLTRKTLKNQATTSATTSAPTSVPGRTPGTPNNTSNRSNSKNPLLHAIPNPNPLNHITRKKSAKPNNGINNTPWDSSK